MWIDGDPKIAERKRRHREEAKRRLTGAGWGGGEGPLHRALKEFIMRDPNAALRNLSRGPFAAHDTEYLFPTGDEVDVRLSDRDGYPVLVEVKPDLDSASLASRRGDRLQSTGRYSRSSIVLSQKMYGLS
jgi:hypothetical protein